METAVDSSTKTPPPYFAFRTLLNTLDTMKDKGVPNRVDRTFLVGMSGAGQTQFIAGLKGLDLIGPNGEVSQNLKDLASASPAARKSILAKILEMKYPEAVELGKTNATTGQLVEIFNGYGLQGDTARKAIAFYLNAARYTGEISLSPLFQTPKVTSSGTKRRPRQQNQRHEEGNENSNDDAGGPIVPDLHPALAGVLSELPKRGKGWTVQRRDEFMTTFQAAANFTIPVLDNEGDDEDETEEEPFEE